MTKLFLLKSTNPPSPSTPVTRPVWFSARCADLRLDVSSISSWTTISVIKNILKQPKMQCILIYSCKPDHVTSLLSTPQRFLSSLGIKADILTMAWKTCHPSATDWASPLPLTLSLTCSSHGGLFAVPPTRQALVLGFCIGCILCLKCFSFRYLHGWLSHLLQVSA